MEMRVCQACGQPFPSFEGDVFVTCWQCRIYWVRPRRAAARFHGVRANSDRLDTADPNPWQEQNVRIWEDMAS